MKNKTILAQILDSIAISICIFLISFVWSGKLLNKNKIICLVFSCALTFICLFILIALNLRKKNLFTRENNKKSFINNCIKYLKFCSKSEYISFISKVFCSKFIFNYFFKNKEKYLYIDLRKIQNENDFYEINNFYQDNNLDEIILVCENYDDNFISLVNESKNNFILYDSQSFISLLCQTNLYPIDISQKISKKEKLNKYLKNKKSTVIDNISKKHFKDFFFSGISLIILSIFIPFSSYYIYFGTILLIFSIICLLNNHKSNIPKEKITLIQQIKRDG